MTTETENTVADPTEQQRAAAREELRAGPKIPDAEPPDEVPSGADAEKAAEDEVAEVESPEEFDKRFDRTMYQAMKHWPKHRIMLFGGLCGEKNFEAVTELMKKYAYRDADGNVVPVEDETDHDHDDNMLGLLTKCLDSFNPDYQKKLLERYTAEVLPERYKEAEQDKATEQAGDAFYQQIKDWPIDQINDLVADIKSGRLSPETESAEQEADAETEDPDEPTETEVDRIAETAERVQRATKDAYNELRMIGIYSPSIQKTVLLRYITEDLPVAIREELENEEALFGEHGIFTERLEGDEPVDEDGEPESTTDVNETQPDKPKLQTSVEIEQIVFELFRDLDAKTKLLIYLSDQLGYADTITGSKLGDVVMNEVYDFSFDDIKADSNLARLHGVAEVCQFLNRVS